MKRVEKILFATAYNFYKQLGMNEYEASYKAWLDVKQKMGLKEEEWIDITTGQKVDINVLELS